jgi:adenine-specific DNA-methyltransferase
MNFKINESKQKLRGGYYTPHHIALFMSRWVAEIQPNHVLEPSCGDGVFLRALRDSGLSRRASVFACELEPEEASKATGVADELDMGNVNVHAGDFLAWALQALRDGQTFDAVCGNPPFVRYQYIDRSLQVHVERLFDHLSLTFTKHTNLWVPFIAASLALLRPGGRMAFVVPSELLHLIYAGPLRDYLGQNCRDIAIVDPTDIWFGDTLQGVLLLFAEKKPESSTKLATLEIVPVGQKEHLSGKLGDLRNPSRPVTVAGLGPKWLTAFLTPRQREALNALAVNPHVREFSDVADVDVGIVTGANKFFFVTDETVERHSLHEWARPMLGRSEHVEGVIYDAEQHERNREAGRPTNFLDFDVPFLKKLPKKTADYIRTGEAQSLHRRYKCRIREPWYVVPSVYAAPLGLLKRSQNIPRLFVNELGALTTDTAYRVQPKSASPSSIVGSFVNSLTALTAELEGRHYGGGVLELVPSEIERLLIPMASFTKSELRTLDASVKRQTEPFTLLKKRDAILCRKLDLDQTLLTTLHEAYTTLRGRRLRLPLPPSSDDE